MGGIEKVEKITQTKIIRISSDGDKFLFESNVYKGVKYRISISLITGHISFGSNSFSERFNIEWLIPLGKILKKEKIKGNYHLKGKGGEGGEYKTIQESIDSEEMME